MASVYKNWGLALEGFGEFDWERDKNKPAFGKRVVRNGNFLKGRVINQPSLYRRVRKQRSQIPLSANNVLKV
jgi:hypothetical protein